jgi:site-specific recombinase XerD
MAVFFMPKTTTTQKWSLTSVAVRDAYTDFILSRQAMNCPVATLKFYRNTVGKFLVWIEQRGITSPEEVTARYIREYIAELAGRV